MSGQAPPTRPNQPEMNQPGQQFRLDTALSMISGIGFTGADREKPTSFGDLNDMARYMTSDETVEAPQLPRIRDEIKDAIIKQNPLLTELLKDMPTDEPPLTASDEEQDAYDAKMAAWHGEVMDKYSDWMGDTITVQPISPEDHTNINVLDEMRMIREQAIGEEAVKFSQQLEGTHTPQDLIDKADEVLTVSPVEESTESHQDTRVEVDTDTAEGAGVTEEELRQLWGDLAYTPNTTKATNTKEGIGEQPYVHATKWYPAKTKKLQPYDPLSYDKEALQRHIDKHGSAWQESNQRPRPDDEQEK